MNKDEIKLKIIIASQEEDLDKRYELHKDLKSLLQEEKISAEDISNDKEDGSKGGGFIVGLLEVLLSGTITAFIDLIIYWVQNNKYWDRNKKQDLELIKTVTDANGNNIEKKLKLTNVKNNLSSKIIAEFLKS